MSDHTDGLDAAMLAHWRARLDALLAEMAAVWDQGKPEGQARRHAWYALGNATFAVQEAIDQLDWAAGALGDDAGEGGGDGR